jgi:lipopolysaccharide export system permease protein
VRLVTRYVLREHAGPLAFAVTTLTSLLLLNYISKRFADLVGKGLPLGVIGEFFVLSIPFTVAMTFPMAVLIATLYAFSRLAADSEITAMMANGVGTRQLLSPVLGAGLVLSIVMLAFNDQVLPRANFRLNALQSVIGQKKPTLMLREQTMNEVSLGRVYLQMARLDKSINMMHDVTIHDLNDPQIRRTIIADSGLLALSANRRDLHLTLFNGFVQETRNANPDKFQRVFFATNLMRIEDVENQLQSPDANGYKGDREMSVCEMQRTLEREQHKRDSLHKALAALSPEVAASATTRKGVPLGAWYCAAIAAMTSSGVAHAQTSTRRPPQARRTIDSVTAGQPVQVLTVSTHLEGAERRISQLDVEIQKKFAISIACLVFALLGPPIALRFPRGGVGLTIGVSLSVFAIYYVGLIMGEELADDLKVTPFVAMWAANLLLGAVGVVLALRMGRAGTTSRGSDAADLLSRLMPWRRRRLGV